MTEDIVEGGELGDRKPRRDDREEGIGGVQLANDRAAIPRIEQGGELQGGADVAASLHRDAEDGQRPARIGFDAGRRLQSLNFCPDIVVIDLEAGHRSESS